VPIRLIVYLFDFAMVNRTKGTLVPGNGGFQPVKTVDLSRAENPAETNVMDEQFFLWQSHDSSPGNS
jgi:hypothetical protein